MPAPAAPGPAPAGVLLRACRPRQWLKNGVVAIAPAAAGALTRPGVVREVCGGLVAFCLMSSATYLVNDVRDREADGRHPRKRFRPVAAGELSPRAALRAAAALVAARDKPAVDAADQLKPTVAGAGVISAHVQGAGCARARIAR
jgi:decaprenyl-phosphate phosphoribosyltransferase